MITIINKGDFSRTTKWMESIKSTFTKNSIYDKYGKLGVEALSDATPVRSGKTASSWTYDVEHRGLSSTIVWKNTNINKNVNIAVIIQYGHGTRTGGYVEGVDYINPALEPVFQDIADELWKEVTDK